MPQCFGGRSRCLEEKGHYLRRIESHELQISRVEDDFLIPIHGWQKHGIIWEHNLLVQYEWVGAPCTGLSSVFDVKSDGWRSSKDKDVEFVAFCNVGVEVANLRTLVNQSEPFGLDIVQLAKRSDRGHTKLDKSELVSVIVPEINKYPKRKSNAGRAKTFDYSAILDWLRKKEPKLNVKKFPEIHYLVSDEMFAGRKSPSQSGLLKGIKNVPDGKNWLRETVETFQRT